MRAGVAGASGVAILGAAFLWNGLGSSWQRPELAQGLSSSRRSTPRLRVLAWNLQKAGLVAPRPIRSSPGAVRAHLDRVAALIRAQDPDLVMLSEVVVECTPCPVDQVAYLAAATGMHAWAFGEQYNFGLPVLRIRGGNAVLSRLPLRAVGNQQLAGGGSFLWPANNRRALWCEALVQGAWLRVASIHTDSADPVNNARQVEDLLRELGERPAILAGDFNAVPESESMRRLRESRRFGGAAATTPTFPAGQPSRRLDYVLAPAGWRVLSQAVIPTTLSDHRPVLGVFELPDRGSRSR